MGFKLQILIQDGRSNHILNVESPYFWYLILSQDTQLASASHLFQSSPNTIHHLKNLIMSFPLSFEGFQSNANLPSTIALRMIGNRFYLEIRWNAKEPNNEEHGDRSLQPGRCINVSTYTWLYMYRMYKLETCTIFWMCYNKRTRRSCCVAVKVRNFLAARSTSRMHRPLSPPFCVVEEDEEEGRRWRRGLRGSAGVARFL